MNRSATTFVKVIPAAGMASVYSPHVSRSRGHYPIVRTKEDHQRIAMRRAQFALEATIRAHRCDTFATLTFRDLPAGASEIRETWKKVLRRSQPSTGDLFYAMVAEAGPHTRPHLHVVTGSDLAESLSAEWKPYGEPEVVALSFDEFGRVSEYLSKGFASPERLFSRRYTALRGSKPKMELFEVSNHHDGLDRAAQFSECATNEVTEDIRLPFGHLTKVVWSPC